MKSLQKISIHPGNGILVIVDAQNEVCRSGGKRCSGMSAQIMPAVLSAIRSLAEQCRNVHLPILYIQSVRILREPEFTVFGRKPILEMGTWDAEIVDELTPQQGDLLIQKFPHEPFYKTDLDQVLQRLVPDPTKYYAVLTGGGINVCLYHAVMGFYLRVRGQA